jgi:hypothetical protein
MPLVGSVAFINKAEGVPCTKAKLWGDFPKLPDCNVTMASGNVRVHLLWIPLGNGNTHVSSLLSTVFVSKHNTLRNAICNNELLEEMDFLLKKMKLWL